MIVGFHHAGIVVADLDLATRFYCEALGFEVSSEYNWDSAERGVHDDIIGLRGTAASCRVLKGPNCFLELFHYDEPEPAGDPATRRPCDYGVAHLSFQVTDIFTVFERLKAVGGVVHCDPVPYGDGHSVYCRDPFGNIIELMEVSSHEPEFDLIEASMLPPPVRQAAQASRPSRR